MGRCARVPGPRPMSPARGPGAYSLVPVFPRKGPAMGVMWGAGMEQHTCPTRGVGICSCLMYFLRSLGSRLLAWVVRA
jgi:hypothetical protein